MGDEINSSIWDSFYTFYLNTVNKKWGGVYLNRTFFETDRKFKKCSGAEVDSAEFQNGVVIFSTDLCVLRMLVGIQ